ncbi:MAG: aminomethyl-transferring glycine dehydrogenase subunit GcvPA [candidate division Zixibacteria bacterium]|nr:aminomethyl-transferring glycine dehydrogenase subunit GcvPA [candidate division Zixibacteria bacterium]
MSYVSNTPNDRKEMLAKIGVRDFEELLREIPKDLRLNRPLNIPQLSEFELLAEIKAISERNQSDAVCFAGGGNYDHFIPAVVNAVITRPEFMTAYTPYQAEVAQGTLQVIYEYQTHLCRLTGMDVANASLYDGGSACAESTILSINATNRSKIIVGESLNPLYREVIRTYLSPREIEIVTAPMKDGLLDLNRLEDLVDEKTACVIVQQPNFFGLLEDIDRVVAMTHKIGGLVVMSIDPIAQALLKTPAEYGADIAVGEGQPLGIPMSFGGPGLGFFATTKALVRNVPGRLAARTKDLDGKTGFVLTLQTREQHIRREKATSNICTNQALCAAAATVYLSLLGRTGLKRVALLSFERAQSVYQAVSAIEGYEPYFKGAYGREFAVRTPRPASEIIDGMLKRGILAGIDAGRWYRGLDDCLIMAATEKRTASDIARLVDGLKELNTRGVLSRM